MDRGALWAALCGVTKSQTWLKQLSTLTCTIKAALRPEGIPQCPSLARTAWDFADGLSMTSCCCLVTQSCLTLLRHYGL